MLCYNDCDHFLPQKKIRLSEWQLHYTSLYTNYQHTEKKNLPPFTQDFHIYRWMFVESQLFASPSGSKGDGTYTPLLERIRQRGGDVDLRRALDVLQAVRVKRQDRGDRRTVLAVPERLYEDAAKKGLGVTEMISILQAVCKGSEELLGVPQIDSGKPDLEYLAKAMDVDLADLHLLVTPAFFHHILPFTSIVPSGLPRVESNVLVTRTGAWAGFAAGGNANASVGAPTGMISNSSISRSRGPLSRYSPQQLLSLPRSGAYTSSEVDA